ncbi:hypothetical protein ACN28S_25890 [Cystobacter fuscus]
MSALEQGAERGHLALAFHPERGEGRALHEAGEQRELRDIDAGNPPTLVAPLPRTCSTAWLTPW